MGVELEDDDVAYRCNLVTIDDAGTMVDFAAGHLTSEQSAPIIAALDAALGGGRDGIHFHPGVEYRHLCVVPRALGDAECVPPHDLTGQPAVWPTGPSAAALRVLMDASREIVGAAAREVGSTATQIWLWGQGVKPRLPRFTDRFGVEGRLTSAVDLVRGLGVLADIEVLDVPGATAGFDNDYVAQRDAALTSLGDRDFFLLHVEATDEAGHQGLVGEKVAAVEAWDRDVIGPLCDALPEFGAHRIMLLPDHATPCALRTHTSDPVPYLFHDSTRPGAGGDYSEAATASSAPIVAHELMARLVGTDSASGGVLGSCAQRVIRARFVGSPSRSNAGSIPGVSAGDCSGTASVIEPAQVERSTTSGTTARPSVRFLSARCHVGRHRRPTPAIRSTQETPMAPEKQLERSMLDGKDREELHAIASAIGVKGVTRLKKADLVDAILTASGNGAPAAARPTSTTSTSNGDKPKRVRSRRSAAAGDPLAALAAEEAALPSTSNGDEPELAPRPARGRAHRHEDDPRPRDIGLHRVGACIPGVR